MGTLRSPQGIRRAASHVSPPCGAGAATGHGLHILLLMRCGQSSVERGVRLVETSPPESGRYIGVTGRRIDG